MHSQRDKPEETKVLRRREDMRDTLIRISLRMVGGRSIHDEGQLLQSTMLGKGSPNERDQKIKVSCKLKRAGGKGRKWFLNQITDTSIISTTELC